MFKFCMQGVWLFYFSRFRLYVEIMKAFQSLMRTMTPFTLTTLMARVSITKSLGMNNMNQRAEKTSTIKNCLTLKQVHVNISVSSPCSRWLAVLCQIYACYAYCECYHLLCKLKVLPEAYLIIFSMIFERMKKIK